MRAAGRLRSDVDVKGGAHAPRGSHPWALLSGGRLGPVLGLSMKMVGALRGAVGRVLVEEDSSGVPSAGWSVGLASKLIAG